MSEHAPLQAADASEMRATAEASAPLTIICCVKFTPDVDEIGVDPTTGAPNLARAGYRINDFDENGIEAALGLRDERGGRVLGVSVVPARPPENLILQALAMGVDEMYLACDPAVEEADALAIATILAAAVRRLGAYDLVVCSDTSVDEYRGEIGPRLAEELGIPCVTYAIRLTGRDGFLEVDRALETRVETVEVPLPALVTVGSETNEPRMPSLRMIKQAASRQVVEWPLRDLVEPDICQSAPQRIRTLTTLAPPSERKRIEVGGEDPDEVARTLVGHLLEEGSLKL